MCWRRKQVIYIVCKIEFNWEVVENNNGKVTLWSLIRSCRSDSNFSEFLNLVQFNKSCSHEDKCDGMWKEKWTLGRLWIGQVRKRCNKRYHIGDTENVGLGIS